MSGLTVEALSGCLSRPLLRGELATLMAAEGLGEPSAERRGRALEVVEGLVQGRALAARRESREVEVPGAYRVFEPYDSRNDSPLEWDRIDPETGKAGRWVTRTTIMGVAKRPEGARPVYRMEVTEAFDAADVAALLRGPIGTGLVGEGWATDALRAWCESAGQRPEEPMSRRDIADRYEFVRTAGKSRGEAGRDSYSDMGELQRYECPVPLRSVEDQQGMFYLSDVRKSAESKGWEMREKPVRASVSGSSLVPASPFAGWGK